MTTTTFSTIADRYQVFFFDAFGVLKNYKGLIPGVAETFAHLREQQKLVYILTNDASRSPEQLAISYQQAGLPDVSADMIISSGDAGAGVPATQSGYGYSGVPRHRKLSALYSLGQPAHAVN